MFQRDYSLEYINNSQNLIILGDYVYDISNFEHPGGDTINVGVGTQAIQLFWSYHPKYLTSMFDAHCNGINNFFNDIYVGKVSKNLNYNHPPSNPFVQRNFSLYDELKSRVERELNQSSKIKDYFELFMKYFFLLLFWIITFLNTYFNSNSFIISLFLSILLGFINSMIAKNFWCYRYQCYLPILYSLIMSQILIQDFIAVINKNWDCINFEPLTWKYLTYIIFQYLTWKALTDINFQPLTWKGLILFITRIIFWIYYRIFLPIMFGKFWYLIFVEYFVTSLILVILSQMNYGILKKRIFKTQHSKYKDFHFSKDRWMYQQIIDSCNFSPGSWFWNHITGGLNHQIEHCLFPGINHVHYPKIASIVQQICYENNVPYNYHQNLWDVIVNYSEVIYQVIN